MDPLTRRTFLASLAATLAAGSSPALAGISSPPPANVTNAVPLYVHHQCGGLLSFGKQYDDFSDMPEWTWRRYIAHNYRGDYKAQELDAAAIEYAKQEFSDQTGVDADDLDEHAFLRWLEEPVPDNGDLRVVEWWLNHEAPAAQAAQIFDMLGIETPDEGYEDGIYITHFPDFGVTVDEQGLERLKNAIAASGLQIEIIETR